MEASFFELAPKGKDKNELKNILLIHGWGANKERLRPLGQKLAQDGWHVVALDLPGFGKTSPPPIPYSLSGYTEFVRSFSNKVFEGRSYVVFGHSFGGRIGVKLADLEKNVIGLVLCAASGFTRSSPLKRLPFLWLAKLGKILVVIPGLRFLANPFRYLLYKLIREHDYQKTHGILRAAFRRIIAEDIKPIAAKLKVPTLILWGEEDRMTPVKGAYVSKQIISRSLIKIYPKLGHTLPYRRSARVAHEITIWSKTFLR